MQKRVDAGLAVSLRFHHCRAICAVHEYYTKRKNIMGKEIYRELTKTVYDSDDLTKMLGISVSRLWRIRQQGYLRKLPGGGKKRGIKVPRAEVVRYLESVAA